MTERLFFPVPKADSFGTRATEVDDETDNDESASRGQRAGKFIEKEAGRLTQST